MNIDSIVSDIDRMARVADGLEKTKTLIGTFEEAERYRNLKNDLISFSALMREKYTIISKPEIVSQTPKLDKVPEQCELCNKKSLLVTTQIGDESIYICVECRGNMYGNWT